MPVKKEVTPVQATPETPVSARPFCDTHIAAKIVIGLTALFIGFSVLVAAFGTGFAAGRFTARDGGRYEMMSRANDCQQYSRGTFNRDGRQFKKNGFGQGRSQRPGYPDGRSSGSDSYMLPPNNAPETP